MIKVLIVDDHAIFREGLKSVIQKDPDIEIVGEADDGSTAITRAVELHPEVILMDINMPFNGLRALTEILNQVPDVKILMLTISERDEDLHQAVKSGASGYILKGATSKELVTGIKSAAAGAAIFTPVMASKMLDDFGSSKQNSRKQVSLTEREAEILNLVAAGASNKEIAARLFVSEPTVKTHLRNILYKLHLKNRSQAAVYAAQKDWLNNAADNKNITPPQ